MLIVCCVVFCYVLLGEGGWVSVFLNIVIVSCDNLVNVDNGLVTLTAQYKLGIEGDWFNLSIFR